MEPTIRLHLKDDVVIARQQLMSGTKLTTENVAIRGLIPAGHKVATRDITKGEPVRRYNQIIGFATVDIKQGAHVHTHNLGMGSDHGAFSRDYAIGLESKLTEYVKTPRTFQGIVRADGRVATRNYLGILTSVNCSATVARAIANHFDREYNPEALAEFDNVDGVVALTMSSGCGMSNTGEGINILRRTLSGYARHVNFCGVLMIGLGCETNQISELLTEEGLAENPLFQTFNIQDTGGTRNTIQKGIKLIENMLPLANHITRTELPISHLILGLQCGGSDGYSGISANPALGVAVDLLVKNGATAILSETPEIYGAEHLLTRRAATTDVAEKLIERIKWWEDYCMRNQGEMNNNPSAGNKAGGLTTILEKSLGAVAKGGTMRLEAVYEYAQPVKAKGFVFMDTPGYDPVSATGQVAGGANIICFTTGRGSAYGCSPSPSIKLSTNNALWQRQSEDVDINCGEIVEGDMSIEEKGKQIFELIIKVASGERTKSELHGYGQNEFVPWQVGAVM